MLKTTPGLLFDARSDPVTVTAGLANCQAQNTTYTSKASRIEGTPKLKVKMIWLTCVKSRERLMHLPRYYKVVQI
jgi:hypothetical protein